MSSKFSVDTAKLSKETVQYSEMKRSMDNCVEQLENIRSNLSNYSFGDIQKVLGRLVEEQRGHAESLRAMERVLSDIIKQYEEAEKRIASAGSEAKGIKDIINGIQKSLVDFLTDLIRMLKGWNKESCTYGGDPINLATGNFIYQREYLQMKGLYPMSFQISYNSTEPSDGIMGNGWVHNYQICMKKEGQRAVLHWSDGREEIFEAGEDGIYRHLIGKKSELWKTEEGLAYETEFGITYLFDQEGKNVCVHDRNDNALTMTYDAEGRLEEVKSLSGEMLFYQYNEEGLLVQVSDHTGRMVGLSYHHGCLIETRDEENHVFQFQYNERGNLCRVVNGRNIQTIENEYDDNGRVTLQRYPDGGQLQIEYDDSAKTLHVTEQNGNKIDYVHDEHMRSVETVFSDGKIQYAYNDRNQKTEVIDKKGNKTKYHYDESGNLSQIENQLGEKLEMEYNAMKQVEKIKVCGELFQYNQYDDRGNLISRQDALGRKIEVAYNKHGRPVNIKQPDGSVIRLTYDRRGNICSVREPSGGLTQYEYDDLGQVIASIDGNGNRTEYTYNSRGYLTEVKNAEGNIKRFRYNESAKVTCIEDFDGSRICREYNVINKISKIIDQEGNITALEYDKMYNVACRTEANGAKTQFVYDKLSRLEQVINAKGDRVCYEYDANGNRTKITDACGGTVKLEYDALNRLVTVEDADGSVSHIEYNQFGQMTKMVDAMGGVRRVVYNKAGQKISAIDAKGNETKYAYDELGNIREITDPMGRKTTYEYLPGGLLKQVTYADGTCMSYTYDANRNVKSKRNQNGYILTYTYDSMNRIVQLESSEGQKKNYTYDAVGNIRSVTDANGNRTEYRYSPSGRLIAVTDALGQCTEYRYDEIGELTDIYQSSTGELKEAEKINQSNHKLHFVHYDRNVLGQVQTVTDALGNKERYIYDENGRMTQKTDKDGKSAKMEYTKGGQLAEIQYEDGNSVKFSYNALKQLTEIKDWLGITAIEADELGRPEKIKDYAGREVLYTRGKLGQRLLMQYPSGKRVEYGYDEQMRLQSLRDENGEFRYGYDENGRLSEKIFPNGIKTEYAYYANGALKALTCQDDNGIVESYKYEYDAVGNKIKTEKERRGLSEESGVFRYTYDAVNRLIGVEKDNILLRNYGYDDFGNRTFQQSGGSRTEYYYNEANQMIQTVNGEEITDYAYDARGNLIRITKNGIERQTFAYNAMNRMECAADNTGRTSTYTYNGLGQRVARQVFDHACNPISSVEYVLDQTKKYHNLLMQQEENAVCEYLWDGNIAAEEENGEVHYYLQDELGSPLRYTDRYGKTDGIYGFDEFGNDSLPHQGKTGVFGYAGFQRDTVSCTYFVHAREYMPSTGRFTSRDMVKGIQSAPYTLNEYSYCWNRPLNFVDRDGAFPSVSDMLDALSDAGDAAGDWLGDTVNSFGREISDATTTFFNGADYVWNNYVPDVVKSVVSSGGEAILGKGRELIEKDIFFGYSISDGMAAVSQTPIGEAFLDAVSFDRTTDGVYHADQNCWQKPFGYNDFYDYMFDGFTSMDKRKYTFTSDGTSYTIWMWKGDYLNLGAGCETGIYEGDDYHVNSAPDTNIHMSLALYDKNTGKQIFTYNPTDSQWWITGFNPRYQDYNQRDLEVHGSIDFSNNEKLWNDFLDEYGDEKGWCFDEENKVAYYVW